MQDQNVDLVAGTVCAVAAEWQSVVLEKLKRECPPETITFLWAHTYSVLAFVVNRDRKLNPDQLSVVKSKVRAEHVIQGIAGFFAQMDQNQIRRYEVDFDIMCVITDAIVSNVAAGEKPSDALRQHTSASDITQSIFGNPTIGGVLVMAHIGIFTECLQLKF
jgi:hypothetical protein